MSTNTDLNTETTEQRQLAHKPKSKVLVIDDSRLVRVSVRKLLQDEFELLEAEDGEAGWQVLQQHADIQVVLTDAGMPVLDGFGLIERVRQCDNQRLKEIPLIMITGAEKGQTEVREKAYGCGASDFIIKPFDKTQLIARIRSYIKQDKLKRDLDITAQTLSDHSTVDPFTKLHNRTYFLQRCEQELALAKRHNRDLSIIALGIDDFDEIHAKYGNETGEQVILWVVETLKTLIRKEDCFIRSADHQFVLITPATDRMSAAYLCERLRKKVCEEPYSKTVIALPVSISLGLVSMQRDNKESAENMLVEAERRVAFAQHQGANRMCANEPPQQFAPKQTPLPLPTLDINTTLAALSAQSHNGDSEDLKELAMALLPLFEHVDKILELHVTEQLNAIRDCLTQRYKN